MLLILITNFFVRLDNSTTSSIRSYSSRRFDQELREKELRQEMKKQLCRLQEQQHLQKTRPTIVIGDTSIPFTVSKFTSQMPSTPHILTPNSTDELLPCVEENEEFSPQFDRKNQPWWQPCRWLAGPLDKSDKWRFGKVMLHISEKLNWNSSQRWRSHDISKYTHEV